MSEPGRLPSNQVKAIEALLAGSSQQEAATAAGVVDRTLRRWLTEEGFTAELNTQKSLMLASSTARLIGLLDSAVTAVAEILEGTSDTPKKYQATQLRAAKLVIDSALKLVNDYDILERLERLEQAYNEQV